MVNIRLGVVVLAVSCMLQSGAFAGVITATLTGDPRSGNPDGLVVDVTINLSTKYANWVVAINTPLAHPNAKLDEFSFNIASLAFTNSGDVTVDTVSPTDWIVSKSIAQDLVLQGSGGMKFQFESTKSVNSAENVTNSKNLTFRLINNVRNWETTDFLNAPYSSPNGNNGLPSSQLGAHLQSLNAGQGESDSGIALGNYVDSTPPPPGPGVVPEPASGLIFLLLSTTGLGLCRFRKSVA